MIDLVGEEFSDPSGEWMDRWLDTRLGCELVIIVTYVLGLMSPSS